MNITNEIKKIYENIVAKIKDDKKNTIYIIIGIFVYIMVIFMGCHISIELGKGSLLGDAITGGIIHFADKPFELRGLFDSATIPHLLRAIGFSTLAAGFVVAWFYIEASKYKNTMQGKEAGTAGWNKNLPAYNKVYTDPKDSPSNDGPYNMILTQDVFLSLNTYNTRRNNNVCIVGGSGSGKSRFFVKPNILQANTNYIITDPAGELLASTGEFLKQQGYDIKVFNLVEMAKSDCYNPFNYIRDDLGVLMMINCLIKNTNGDSKGGGDPFWEKSETALLQALCFYLIKYRPKSEQNFTSVMKLLRAAEIDEQNPKAKSKLDRIFDDVEKKDPTSIALKQYQTFKMGAGKTLKSILISCSVRLTVFNLRQIESLTGCDTLDLGSMGTGKKALFVIIPAADNTYNFLVSMMYSQLFETLYFVAETTTTKKKLERHVRFLLDEFANIGQIPEFTQKLATMRKYEISCNIILQNLAQIKTMYKDDWQTIIGNCDSFLFLGGQEYDTLKYISDELGDQTITAIDSSRSRGKSGSSSRSTKHQGRKLMFPDEIGRMENSQCILIIRGERPFFTSKYEYTKHPNYKLTGDADDNLIYINTINNTKIETPEEIEDQLAKNTALKFAEASAKPTPKNKLIGDMLTLAGLSKTLNISPSENLPARFTVVAPDDNHTISENESDKLNTDIVSNSGSNFDTVNKHDTFSEQSIDDREVEKIKSTFDTRDVVLPQKKKNSNVSDEAEEWFFDSF